MSTPQPPLRDGESRLFTSTAGRRRFVERIEKVRAAYDAVCASNGDAAEAGDNSVWHDNFDYEENQRQMHQLARRVRDLQDALRRMEVADAPRTPDRVGFGCAVVLETEDDRTERLVIGGYEDGDPDLHRVSYTAPIAQALMGAEPGDTRVVRVGGRTRELAVLSVERAQEAEL